MEVRRAHLRRSCEAAAARAQQRRARGVGALGDRLELGAAVVEPRVGERGVVGRRLVDLRRARRRAAERGAVHLGAHAVGARRRSAEPRDARAAARPQARRGAAQERQHERDSSSRARRGVQLRHDAADGPRCIQDHSSAFKPRSGDKRSNVGRVRPSKPQWTQCGRRLSQTNEARRAPTGPRSRAYKPGTSGAQPCKQTNQTNEALERGKQTPNGRVWVRRWGARTPSVTRS